MGKSKVSIVKTGPRLNGQTIRHAGERAKVKRMYADADLEAEQEE